MRSALNSSVVWELASEGQRLFHCGIVWRKKSFGLSLYVWYPQYCTPGSFQTVSRGQVLVFSIYTAPQCILWKRNREDRSTKSFIKISNRIGPKTDPWGTPDNTGTRSEAWPSKTTCWVCPESHELRTFLSHNSPAYAISYLAPYVRPLQNPLWSNMSVCVHFRLLMMSCTNWTKWVLQDLWLLKPCW